MNLFKSTQIGLIILLVLQIAVFSGCDQYKELTNDPPKVTNFAVPAEVEYGETVKLSVRVFDPENDALIYLWDVSDGTLVSDTGAEVQWTAPELPREEIVPPKVVTVNVSVRDGGEENVTKSASIIVFSQSYRVVQALSGTYRLVTKRVHGDPVEEVGILRLTTTTFTREFQDILEGEVQGQTQFATGFYKFIKPFNESSGTIHWFTHGDPRPSISTYTWDGKFFVLVLPATSTQYVYSRAGADPGGVAEENVSIIDEEDVEPEPVDPDDEPVEVVEEDVEPEPIDVDNEPVEELEEVVNPDPVNADGKPVEITDATFKANVLDAQLPVVLEFGADWCPFCRQMKPIVASVALEHRATFIIGKLDIDENPLTTRKYNVGGIPAYLVFRDGALVARFGGAMPKQIFVKRILDALK